MLKILHISDFHYKPENKEDFIEIASQLRQSLRDKEFDLVVFFGDLVCEGKEEKTFEAPFALWVEKGVSHRLKHV